MQLLSNSLNLEAKPHDGITMQSLMTAEDMGNEQERSPPTIIVDYCLFGAAAPLSSKSAKQCS